MTEATLPQHPFGTDITADDIVAQMQLRILWEEIQKLTLFKS